MHRYIVYSEPLPPRPAPGEVGTHAQQLVAVRVSLLLAEVRFTSAADQWPEAFELTTGRKVKAQFTLRVQGVNSEW